MTVMGAIGLVGAMVLSWTTWGSLGWMLFHGFLGWFYIFYWVIVHG